MSDVKPGDRVFCYVSRKDFMARGVRDGRPLTIRVSGTVYSVHSSQIGVELDMDVKGATTQSSPYIPGSWVTYIPSLDVTLRAQE